MPESRSRRLLELRLLHTWVNYLQNPFQFPKDTSALWWSSELPRLALQYDNIQYLLFASSASYLVRHAPHDLDALTAQRTYTCLALQAQRKAVADLTIESSQAVCFAALLLVVRAFTDLGNRPLEPYRPPIEWLHMGRGGATVFRTAQTMLVLHQQASLPSTAPGKTMSLHPILKRNTIVAKQEGLPYSYLLAPDSGGELGDADALAAYEFTLRILGSISDAIAHGEPLYALAKRLVAFAMYVPQTFIDFVGQQRPRALAILAQYFALLIQADPPLWWIGNIPRREIQAIQKVLSPEWQDLIRESLAVAEHTPE